MKEKLKSWPLWLAVASLIIFCTKELSGADISESVNGLLNVILPVAVGFGIVNNPNDRTAV